MQLALERLIYQDDFATIIKEARPHELVVIMLRLGGFDNKQIGARLGISGSAVGLRMHSYRDRVCAKHPDLAHLIRGRRLKPGPQRCENLAFQWLSAD